MLINTFCAASFIYLGFTLWLKSRDQNTLANRWLALFLLFVSFLQLDDAFMAAGTYLIYPHLFSLLDPFIFAVAPCLYWSVFHFTQPDRRFYPQSLLHFTPAMLLFVLSIPAFLESEKEKLELIKILSVPKDKINTVAIVAFSIVFLQCILYLSFSFIEILKHQKRLQLITSNKAESDLNWLKYFLLVIAVLLGLWMLEIGFFKTFAGAEMSWGYLLGCYFLGYHAIRQKEIFPFASQDLQDIHEIMQENESLVHSTSIFDPDQKERLIQLIENEKPYLDPELSLPKLAKMMNCSTHELSNLINRGFERNFYQLINAYRIEESKHLLLDEQLSHLNILAIGFEAGFNSKTTFNTTFKNLTGMSPLEYRKQHLLSDNP
ncbi:AraC family transcriptional regulator [Haliscomenobacter hydrossis]|uniref:Transcriptional regulator, AraC family n=1 Tax=Haliscomenobacter hydrossis (strain ATCC 27775 / DSM 1100 / LMG 10767 / O) TaxID=760192 RepID=F4KWY9_HALH1|nr:helix-turn-helix domain-containing protein [Haliscomenobacter hydrossis]AEE53589.1 transcriptional regulator, AraC family [Haliscomenobacter hydrossis DSM 1100]